MNSRIRRGSSKLLSPGNLAVLATIRRNHPTSTKDLAALGIISLANGPNRTLVPALIAHRVRLEIDLTGHPSAVAIDAPP